MGTLQNAEQTVCNRISTLNVGKRGIETTSSRGSIRYFFQGKSCFWNLFPEEVSTWYLSPETEKLFRQCQDKPVSVHPATEKANRYFLTKETWKNGAEISSAARFVSNALLPVLHSALTMMDSDGPDDLPETEDDDSLPTEHMSFGDSFTVKDKISGSQPDVVFLVYSKGLPEVRMVGEMKYHVTVNLENYVRLAQFNNTKDLCEVLGE